MRNGILTHSGLKRELFAYFYNHISEGVINDIWMQITKGMRRSLKVNLIRKIVNWAAKRSMIKGKTSLPINTHYDFRTPEYTSFKKIKEEKWESCRGIGNSFGYNKMEDLADCLKIKDLIHMFIDIVSKNGNLLLNVGPMADGTIPEIQKKCCLG